MKKNIIELTLEVDEESRYGHCVTMVHIYPCSNFPSIKSYLYNTLQVYNIYSRAKRRNSQSLMRTFKRNTTTLNTTTTTSYHNDRTTIYYQVFLLNRDSPRSDRNTRGGYDARILLHHRINYNNNK